MSRSGRVVVGLALGLVGALGPAGAAEADAAACAVEYRASAYTGGFTAVMEVKNVGDVAINGWTFRFPLEAGATVVEFWNADLLASSEVVTSRDKGWNAYVEPDGSVSLGFRAVGKSADPDWFTVNGLRCNS